MKTIQLSEFGTFLGTRFLGELVRNAVLEALSENAQVCIDLAGVSDMTHSFSDELFGGTVARLGLSEFRSRIRFSNASQEAKRAIQFVVSERLRLAVA